MVSCSIFKSLQCGEISFKPYVVMADGTKIIPEYDCIINDSAKTAHIFLNSKDKFKDDFYITYNDGEIISKRVFENVSSDVMSISELGVELSGITFGKNANDDYFYHNENPRIFKKMTFLVDSETADKTAADSELDEQAGNRWLDPRILTDRIGSSPFQPFPAILLSNYNSKKGLVHGTLSQDVFYHNYLTSHKDDQITLDIFSSFKATKYIEAEKGRVLTDEWYLGTTDEADNLEKIFEKYANALRKKLPVGYGRSEINRDNMVWGTWNDGVFRNVSEELILREAKFLKENFPTVRWIQLDDGYAVYNKAAFGLGVPYEGEEGIDKQKFPNGLRHMTDKVREIGLRPAIWIGGKCDYETKIYKEHPEWFSDYSFRMASGVLDVSQKVVREYMEYAVDVLCKRYGFEGVKHDFWSYAFEDNHDLYKEKEKSGYEYRKWWLKKIRSSISADGYFQTGCDIVMANPFLGEYFTNYRYGIDIGSGKWENIKTNFLWGTACFATHTGDLFVPNSDSVGLFPGLNENEAMFNINYCLATHSMVEIAGLLSQASDEKRIKILKKAVCNPNNGQDVYFINYDYRLDSYSVPEVMYFKTPHFSKIENSDIMPCRTVALFNIEDEKKTIAFSLEELGLSNEDYILTDVWSGEQYEINNVIDFEINPHSSLLLAVNRKNIVSLYDANIRINKVSYNKNIMELETDYDAKDVELSFNRNVKSLSVDGVGLDFTKADGKVYADILPKGIVLVEFM